MNRWNIPPALEALVSARDQRCIYCQRPLIGQEGPRGQRNSWEHIINDENLVNQQNIALCCISCNASKGAKLLSVWLQSPGSPCRARRGLPPPSECALPGAPKRKPAEAGPLQVMPNQTRPFPIFCGGQPNRAAQDRQPSSHRFRAREQIRSLPSRRHQQR